MGMGTGPGKYDRPPWRGRTNVSYVVQKQIEFAESRRTGSNKGKQFVVTQGSFQAGGGDVNSAGTHDKDGCVDLRWTGLDSDLVALRQAGLWAWHRTPAQGPWPDHIHVVSLFVARSRMAAAAQRQLDDALARPPRNGLSGHGPDDGPLVEVEFVWPLPVPTPNITKALNARSVADRKAALKKVAKYGKGPAQRQAEKWLNAMAAQERAKTNIQAAREALKKLEIK